MRSVRPLLIEVIIVNGSALFGIIAIGVMFSGKISAPIGLTCFLASLSVAMFTMLTIFWRVFKKRPAEDILYGEFWGRPPMRFTISKSVLTIISVQGGDFVEEEYPIGQIVAHSQVWYFFPVRGVKLVIEAGERRLTRTIPTRRPRKVVEALACAQEANESNVPSIQETRHQ